MKNVIRLVLITVFITGCSSSGGILDTHQKWKPPVHVKKKRKKPVIRFLPKSSKVSIKSLNNTIDNLNAKQHKPMKFTIKKAPKAKAKKNTKSWKKLEKHLNRKSREL